MSNPFLSYYLQQSGSGLAGFSGTKLQRGFGWWSRLFNSTILPALRYIGKEAVNTGTDVIEDVIDGRNLKDSIQERGLTTLKAMGRTATKKARSMVNTQVGAGRRRRRRGRLTKPKATPRKRAYRRRKRRVTRKFPDFLQ